MNLNIMQRKSKSFVSGVLRKYGRGTKKVKAAARGEELEDDRPPEPLPDVKYDDVEEEHQFPPFQHVQRP